MAASGMLRRCCPHHGLRALGRPWCRKQTYAGIIHAVPASRSPAEPKPRSMTAVPGHNSAGSRKTGLPGRDCQCLGGAQKRLHAVPLSPTRICAGPERTTRAGLKPAHQDQRPWHRLRAPAAGCALQRAPAVAYRLSRRAKLGASCLVKVPVGWRCKRPGAVTSSKALS